MIAASPSPQRALRVAMVFGGAVVQEQTLLTHGEVVLGDDPSATLPLPGGVTDADRIPFMTPTEDGGYEVLLHPEMGGAIWTAAGRKSVASIREDRFKVGPTDYGVLTLGPAAIFFQRVDAGPQLRRVLGFDPNAFASLSMSTFLHLAALFLMFLAQRESPQVMDQELPEDLVRRFLAVTAPELEPTALPSSSDERVEADAVEPTSAAPSGDEGSAEVTDSPRVRTNEPAQRPSSRPSPRRAPNIGILRAIQGDDGNSNALAEATQGPSIQSILDSVERGGPRGEHPGRVGLRPGRDQPGPGRVPGVGPIETDVGDERAREEVERSRGRVRGEHRLRLDPPTVDAPPDYPSDAIQRVVQRHRESIRYCYENELQRRPNLAGRVELSWRIGSNGRAQRVRVARSTMRAPGVEGCMARQVGHWSFTPPSHGTVGVQYPFIFTGG